MMNGSDYMMNGFDDDILMMAGHKGVRAASAKMTGKKCQGGP